MVTIKSQNGKLIKNADGTISTCCCDWCSECFAEISAVFATSPEYDLTDLTMELVADCYYSGEFEYSSPPNPDWISIDIWYENGCWNCTAEGAIDAGGAPFFYSSDPYCLNGCFSGHTFVMSYDAGEDLGELEIECNELGG